MIPFSESLGVFPSPSVLRSDIGKPTSLGFMKEISDEQLSKETELSTIINDNLKLLETVTLPDHLKFKEVSKYLQKMIEKDVKQDSMHELAVKIAKYAQNFFEKMELYFAQIYDYDNTVRERLKSSLFGNAKEYLSSDMPSSYLRALALSYLTESKYIDVFDSRIRRERLKLITVRNNRPKFKRVCDEHNRWVDFLDPLCESMIDSRLRLLWYVDLNNCKTAKKAFKVKELRKSNLNDEHFFGLLVDMQRKTEKFREALIKISRKTFLVTVDRKDPTADLLCNVMEIMSK